jgi:hypothetical protein
MELITTVAILVLIALIWFLVVRDGAKEPFMAALIEKFPAIEGSVTNIALKRHFIGWTTAGSSIARTSGISRLGIAHDSLFIVEPPLIDKLIPTTQIPLKSLSKIDSRFFWSAMSRFDVFKIDGISEGSLLLPVGLVSEVDQGDDDNFPAT